MAVETEWRTRLHPPAEPGAAQAGARTANAIAALEALQCSMAPPSLCSLCALPTLQRKPCFAALFCLEQVATSQVPGQVEWVHPALCALHQHPPLLFFPRQSCGTLCSSLPPLPLSESLSKSQGVLSCVPRVKTHQLTVLAYLMRLRMAPFMPLLTWHCCKHTLPLHVHKSVLSGSGFHCVLGCWSC